MKDPLNMADWVTTSPGSVPQSVSHKRVFEKGYATGDLPGECCIHQLFEIQAGRVPHKAALVYQGKTLSYDELNRRANQLGNHLVKLGVGPESLVGLLVERSMEMVVGILGILKAGGAYVPIDPQYPQERVNHILADSRATLVVTQTALAERLGNAGAKTVLLDDDAELISGESQENVACSVRPDNLAYVIYTSGSTGRPKGAMISHFNVVRLFASTNAWFHFSSHDVWTLFHSIAFDFSVWELWGALLYGGKLVIVPFDLSRSPEDFLNLLRQEAVTVLNQTPSAFRQLIRADELWGGELTALKWVVFGGEALDFKSLKPWFDRHGDRHPQLVNMYGITETTVHVTYRPVGAADVASGRGSLIGVPIPDLEVRLLDEHLQPVADGAPGEICVCGAGVGRGYWNRPELTAEKFLSPPSHSEPGKKMYRSGDLARLHPDGELEYLGRIDLQVKIRGFRIELGEIEDVLAGHPAVRECVVVAHETQGQEKELVAYVVVRDSGAPTVSELRRNLLQHLPEYMVPSVFVKVDKFPLTANGKIDRRALPSADVNRLSVAVDHKPPTTATEVALEKIWRELLGGERVGITDHFFALGGHSLLAVRLIFRIRERFQVDLPTNLASGISTIEEMARMLDQLALADVAAPAAGPVRLPRAATSQPSPFVVSYNQEQLWLIHQLETRSSDYNVLVTFRWQGDLDRNALERALNQVIQRHEALRTTFPSVNGAPVQMVFPEHVLVLKTHHLESLPDAERQNAENRLLVDGVRQPFDLATGPLVRADLLCLADTQHLLLLGVHHIVFDGWSSGVLRDDLLAAYAAALEGRPPELPDLPVQYADFAAWQRRHLTPDILSGQMDYWRRQLAGVPMELDLPTDRPYSGIQRKEAAEQRFTLCTEVAANLRRLGREHETTLFAVLLAAFHTLLYRYSNQSQILIGVPFAGRNRAEVERLIGYFVNSLPIKADFRDNPAFEDVLEQLKKAIAEAQARQEVPFGHLVRELQPSRTPKRNPLFQVLVVLEAALLGTTQSANLKVHVQEVAPPEAMFDLLLSLTDKGAEVEGVLRYNTDLFNGTTVARMVAAFETLLAGIVQNPRLPVSELPLLAGPERHRLLVEWNHTVEPFSRVDSVHEMFEAQVERTPEAAAILYAGQELSYQELNWRSNQLAHWLRGMGVTPDSMVGIYLGRSVDYVVALLGILKAGAAYMPLDPELPADRIRFMVEDATPQAVVSDGPPPAGRMPAFARIVDLNRVLSSASAAFPANPEPVNAANHLAYVLFTSGSTGHPKGVLMHHGALINLIQWQMQHTNCGNGHRTLQFAPVGFDVCFQEIFSTLASGGSLVIPMPDERKDFAQLARLIGRMRVNRFFLPFVALDNLAPALLADGCLPDALREVVTAGEQLRVTPAIRELFQRLPAARLVNQYGPTEAHVVSSFQLAGNAGDWPALPPIGRPIANARIYILDAHLHPVPIGVAGELVIGGIPVSKGYLNRPELTAEKFIADPFDGASGARLYKTGDLCRYRADGNIEYLGRMDQQVKIRGFRIELGEIESVLAGHPRISGAAVIAWENIPGNKQLVAYVVASEGEMPAVQELRARLERKLPEYMIPSAFVCLDKLPLSPNGKIDRKALPAPDKSRPGSSVAFVAPQTGTETALARIWRELLGMEQIGVHDNFFALGGHSLLAVRMNFRIGKELGLELPLKQVAELPTISQLAAMLDELAANTRRARGETPDVGGTTGPATVALSQPLSCRFPLTPGQEQLWFLAQLAPESSVYNLSLMLRLRGPLNVEALRKSLNFLVRRHEALRSIFPVENGLPVTEILPELTVPLPAVKAPSADGNGDVNRWDRSMLELVRQPFDLSRGPLVRAGLFEREPTNHSLVLVIHHIVWDGWSSEILLRELAAAYAAFSKDVTPVLPDLPTRYAVYVEEQRQRLTSARIQSHLDFWRQELSGAPMLLELPFDHPSTGEPEQQGAEHLFVLGRDTTTALRRMAQERGNTLFTTVLAAFHVLLHRFSRQNQVLVGVPFAGRTSPELESVIGYFVNALPVKADFDGNPTFEELLSQIKKAIWSVQERQDLPFERLVREFPPARDANRNPIFQVCLVFEVASTAPCPIPGLQVDLQKLEPPEAMFDLMLVVTDVGEHLSCSLRYNADLFDRSNIVRLTEGYELILEAVTGDPRRRISELPVLLEAEHRTLLVEWNRTVREYPCNRCVHELFEEKASQNPFATALISDRQELSYADLNARSNRLAHYLRAQGVTAKSLVGVRMGRSVAYVTSLLAVLKAGGAYVPLDPGYPRQRLQFMVADAALKLIITDQPLAADLDLNGVPVLDISVAEAVIETGPGENPEPVSGAEDPAYVIYTSGSTGQPKGVVVPHRGVVRLVRGQDYFDANPAQRFLLLASTSFDATTFELWGPLLNGASCVVFPSQLESFEQLERVIRRHEVTCLWLTAGLFNQIINARPSVLQTVKHVLTGGEALSVPHVKKAMEQLPSLQLTNGYGPTESTTFACCYAIRPGETFSRGSVPIGRPIANTTCYLLDAHLQPVPVGVAGELHLGGDGLALGYLNRPELTAEKFIPNPFSDQPGARLYKTGDLCRYRADGNIEFLGRLDQQVKLRGFRIELGEIEAALGRYPSVLNAAVMLREDVPGNQQLVAYVVMRPGSVPTAVELRASLGQELPDYMIPGAFVFMDHLPLTANGKVDRHSLPAPEKNPGASWEAVAPKTPVELKLAEIWRELLGVKQVGLHDNFFTLGGHSLLAVRLVAEIKQRMQVILPVRQVFQQSTFQELAAQLQEQKPPGREPELIRLNAGGTGPELYFLIDEGSLGLFKLAPYLDQERPLFASVVPLPEAVLQASLKKNLSALPSLEEWAARHVTLIRNRPTQGPILLAGHCFGGVLAFEVAQQLKAAGIEVAGVILLDTWMARPGYWWEKKAWFQEHVGNLLRKGPGYLWQKGARRIWLEKKELMARIDLTLSQDFNLHVPWTVIERIYRQAMRGYRPQPLSCRAKLLVSQEDWMAKAYRRMDHTLGAGRYFSGGVEVGEVPGNHVTILSENYLPELAEQFNRCLTALV
jgi:amino acid adenylation domain-containing protein